MYSISTSDQVLLETVSDEERMFNGITVTEPLSGRCVGIEAVSTSFGWNNLRQGNVVCLKSQPEYFTEEPSGIVVYPIPFYVQDITLSEEADFYGFSVKLIQFGTEREIKISGSADMTPQTMDGVQITEFEEYTDVGLVSDMAIADWFDAVDEVSLRML